APAPPLSLATERIRCIYMESAAACISAPTPGSGSTSIITIADRPSPFASTMGGGTARRSSTVFEGQMALRIAFDLDGVLADMESELARQAKSLFGDRAATRAPIVASAPPPGSDDSSAEPSPSTNDIAPAVTLDLTPRQLS